MTIPSPAFFGVVDAVVYKTLLLPGAKPELMSYTILTGQGVLPAGSVLGLITASGKLALSASAAGDGSQTPMAILPFPVDTTAGDVKTAVYVGGRFNSNALTFGTGNSITNCRETLRAARLLTDVPLHSVG